ncbi:beta-ketoacyl synthase N-terminal-like domain-containing protein, partial [Streptomyces hyaluromycini]
GAAVARHLVAGHRAPRLLLVGRRGEDDPSIAELALDARESGATVTVAAAAPGDRAALGSALSAVRGPVSAVVHAASGPFGSAAASALVLDDLLSDHGPTAYLLLSTTSDVLGTAGDPEEAAFAAFCDALALRRQERGLPGMSLSVGPWAEDDTPAVRPLPPGVGTLSRRDLLAMTDAALMSAEPTATALRLDAITLYGDAVPAVLRGLVDTAEVTADAGLVDELRSEIGALPEADRLSRLLDAVGAAAADVMGAAPAGVVPERAFKELGFTSVQAVQLRNRLMETTGLRLPATLAFDHPTPRAVAGYLLGELTGTHDQDGTAPVTAAPVDDDPIAIVGMAARLPGGVASPEDLWALVDQGLDAITPFPSDRGWDVTGLYDPDPERSGTTYVRDGGFLEDAGGFDAAFFGISPREALATDPQQRVFLETSWEVFERAGIDVTTLRGSRIGVFAGVMNQDYNLGLAQADEDTEGYRSTGTAASVVSGRVAYTFGFEGPAVTVDTACSSSLVALHLAAQSLRS